MIVVLFLFLVYFQTLSCKPHNHMKKTILCHQRDGCGLPEIHDLNYGILSRDQSTETTKITTQLD